MREISKIKIKQGKHTITTDIAYIAGFMDGEGCIRIKKCGKLGRVFYIWITITNTYKPTLDYIQSIFGGKVRFAEYGENKRIYHYELSAAEAADMLRVVVGFLRDKKPQAELAIRFHEIKGDLGLKEKVAYHDAMCQMKKVENPELLDAKP